MNFIQKIKENFLSGERFACKVENSVFFCFKCALMEFGEVAVTSICEAVECCSLASGERTRLACERGPLGCSRSWSSSCWDLTTIALKFGRINKSSHEGENVTWNSPESIGLFWLNPMTSTCSPLAALSELGFLCWTILMPPALTKSKQERNKKKFSSAINNLKRFDELDKVFRLNVGKFKCISRTSWSPAGHLLLWLVIGHF